MAALATNTGGASFVLNATKYAGAYLLQKGALIGRKDIVKLVPALSNWTEYNTTCTSRPNATTMIDYSCPYHTYVTHQKGWTTADISDMFRCQVIDKYRNASAANALTNYGDAEVNLLLEATEHYYGEVTSITTSSSNYTTSGNTNNASVGRTEWHSSESEDSPILIITFN